MQGHQAEGSSAQLDLHTFSRVTYILAAHLHSKPVIAQRAFESFLRDCWQVALPQSQLAWKQNLEHPFEVAVNVVRWFVGHNDLEHASAASVPADTNRVLQSPPSHLNVDGGYR